MEENVLKSKYNELLKSYETGAKYLEEHPNEQEKVATKLNEISTQMSNILNSLPNTTEEEKEKGFKINEEVISIQGKEIGTISKQEEKINKPTIKVQGNKKEGLMSFEEKWKIANIYSKSSLFPDEFQGHPENILVCIGMSEKMGIDVYTIAQNLHIIKGKLTWSGSFCQTLIELTRKYKDLNLVYFGEEGKDNRGCYLEATRVRDNKVIKGTKITIDLVKKSGWYSKKDKYGNETSKWTSIPEQMLGYRAATFFARLYCPEALNGVLTSEESEDISQEAVSKQPIDIL